MTDELTEAMEDIHQEFRNLEEKLDKRFGAIEERLDSIEGRFSIMDKRFDELLAEIRLANTRLQLVAGIHDHQGTRLTNVENRLSRLEMQTA